LWQIASQPSLMDHAEAVSVAEKWLASNGVAQQFERPL
jgi:hypothetical protein